MSDQPIKPGDVVTLKHEPYLHMVVSDISGWGAMCLYFDGESLLHREEIAIVCLCHAKADSGPRAIDPRDAALQELSNLTQELGDD